MLKKICRWKGGVEFKVLSLIYMAKNRASFSFLALRKSNPAHLEIAISLTTIAWGLVIWINHQKLIATSGSFKFLAMGDVRFFLGPLIFAGMLQAISVSLLFLRARLILCGVQFMLWSLVVVGMTAGAGAITTATTTYSILCVFGSAWCFSRLSHDWEARSANNAKQRE